MESSFKHYLITRYNVPLTGWEKDKHGNSTRDAAWLSHRYLLFNTYCLPGVLAQSNKNFEWLIYLDEDTPTLHLTMLQTLVMPYRFISLRLTRGYVECLADINQTLQQAGAAFVITSRLDNDDALGLDYIRTVQHAFQPTHGLLINILHGHGYDRTRHVAVRLRHIRKNSFMSLVEHCHPEGNHISIRGFPHDEPPKHFTIMNVSHAHGWFKLFHDRNLTSEAFGRPVWSNSFARYYGIQPSAVRISNRNTLLHLWWWCNDGFRRKILNNTSARGRRGSMIT
jgi:hypothetical protein